MYVNVHVFDAVRMTALSMSICCERLFKQKKLRLIRSPLKSTFLDICKPINEKVNQSTKTNPPKQTNKQKPQAKTNKPIYTKKQQQSVLEGK